LFETDKYPPADDPDVYRIETPDRFMMLEKRNSNDYAAQVEMLSADLRLIRLDKKITNNETEHAEYLAEMDGPDIFETIGFLHVKVPVVDELCFSIRQPAISL
jgi:hypothetical protein